MDPSHNVIFVFLGYKGDNSKALVASNEFCHEQGAIVSHLRQAMPTFSPIPLFSKEFKWFKCLV